jgi:hypothetical protein
MAMPTSSKHALLLRLALTFACALPARAPFAQREALPSDARSALIVTATCTAESTALQAADGIARLTIQRRVYEPHESTSTSVHERPLSKDARYEWAIGGLGTSVMGALSIERLTIELIARSQLGAEQCIALTAIERLAPDQREAMARTARLELGELHLLEPVVLARGRFEPPLSLEEQNAVELCHTVLDERHVRRAAPGLLQWPGVGRTDVAHTVWDPSGHFEVLGAPLRAAIQLHWKLDGDRARISAPMQVGASDLLLSREPGSDVRVLIRCQDRWFRQALWPVLLPAHGETSRAGLGMDFMCSLGGEAQYVDKHGQGWIFAGVPSGEHELRLGWHGIDLGLALPVHVAEAGVRRPEIDLRVEDLIQFQHVRFAVDAGRASSGGEVDVSAAAADEDQHGWFVYRVRSADGVELTWSRTPYASLVFPVTLLGCSIEVWSASGHYGFLERLERAEEVRIHLAPPRREIEVELEPSDIDWFGGAEGSVLVLPTQDATGFQSTDIEPLRSSRMVSYVSADQLRGARGRVLVADAPAYVPILITPGVVEGRDEPHPAAHQWWGAATRVDFASSGPDTPAKLVLDPIRRPSTR